MSISGANTLTNGIEPLGSSTVEVQRDSLSLNPSSGDAVVWTTTQQPSIRTSTGW